MKPSIVPSKSPYASPEFLATYAFNMLKRKGKKNCGMVTVETEEFRFFIELDVGYQSAAAIDTS